MSIRQHENIILTEDVTEDGKVSSVSCSSQIIEAIETDSKRRKSCPEGLNEDILMEKFVPVISNMFHTKGVEVLPKLSVCEDLSESGCSEAEVEYLLHRLEKENKLMVDEFDIYLI